MVMNLNVPRVRLFNFSDKGCAKFNYFKRGVWKIGKYCYYYYYIYIYIWRKLITRKPMLLKIPPRRGELNTGTYFLTININCYLITPILA